MLDVQQVWQDTLDVVRGELNTTAFKTWFEQTAPLGIIDQEMVVSVQNNFARDWLETRYSSLLAAALTQVTGAPITVRFSVSGEAAAAALLSNRRHTSLTVRAGVYRGPPGARGGV